MVGIFNFALLVVWSIIFSILYILSVRPAQDELNSRPDPYRRAQRYRKAASVAMSLAGLHFIAYRWLPLAFDPLPLRYQWPLMVRIAVALTIGIPATLLWVKALKDAGRETLIPDKGHVMYGGVYEKIRHPQAIGELASWFTIALLLDSPLLTLVSCFYVPIWILWCFLEEQDLVIRFGDSYREYQERTGMFFPLIRKK